MTKFSVFRFYRYALPVLAVCNIFITFSISRRNRKLILFCDQIKRLEARLEAAEDAASSKLSTSLSSTATSTRLYADRPTVTMDPDYLIYAAYNRSRRRQEWCLYSRHNTYRVGDLTRYGRVLRVLPDSVEFDRCIGVPVRPMPVSSPASSTSGGDGVDDV